MRECTHAHIRAFPNASMQRGETMSEQAPQEPMSQGEQAILSQMQRFRDECLEAVTLCRAEILAQVRQMRGLNKALSDLTQEVQELREQLTKNRLF
jgi:hypothetical protein